MISFLFSLLWLCISFCNAWMIMRSMEYLISFKQGKRSFIRCTMLIGCAVLSASIIFIDDPFNFLATTFFFIVLVLICCEGSFWKRFTLGTMYTSTILSFNALRDNYLKPLFETLEMFIFPEQQILYNDDFINNLSLNYIQTASVFVSFMFSLLLYSSTRKSAPDKDYTLSDDLWKLILLLAISPFCIVFSLSALFDRDGGVYLLPPHYARISVKYLPILLIAIFTFIILLRCIVVLARQQQLEQQSMIAEINRKYYESMEQQHFEIRRLRHDLANHLQILSTLPEDKRDAYLSHLSENTAITQSLSYCMDATVNAVLTVKRNLMERYGISMETAIDIPAELPFNQADVCALYANALDNAIEACMQLPADARRISLKSKAQKGLFCLEVKNPAPNTVEHISRQAGQKPLQNICSESEKHIRTDKIPPTSKSDKQNHGFGLKSIREIVERYHGSLELESADGAFNLFLYIPLSYAE